MTREINFESASFLITAIHAVCSSALKTDSRHEITNSSELKEVNVKEAQCEYTLIQE